MTIRTVTYDDATHVILPVDPNKTFFDLAGKEDDKSWVGSCCAATNESIYACAIESAPPFTSLPNPDLDVIEDALDYAADRAAPVNPLKLYKAFEALKRLKGDV